MPEVRAAAEECVTCYENIADAIEDDESLGEGIRTALRRAAYSVDWLRDEDIAHAH